LSPSTGCGARVTAACLTPGRSGAPASTQAESHLRVAQASQVLSNSASESPSCRHGSSTYMEGNSTIESVNVELHSNLALHRDGSIDIASNPGVVDEDSSHRKSIGFERYRKCSRCAPRSREARRCEPAQR